MVVATLAMVAARICYSEKGIFLDKKKLKEMENNEIKHQTQSGLL